MTKLICVDAYYDATSGFLGMGAKPKRPIEGLTEGKEYTGYPVSEVRGEGNIGFGSISTQVNFLIFNDDGEWQTYNVDCFKPL